MVELPLSAFADEISQIMPVILREFARRQVNDLYKGKITLPQILILEFLSRQGESRMTDLAHFMHVTTANMTGIIDRLVRDAYVVRTYDSKDRRIIKIRLTYKGLELIKKIGHQRRKMLFRIFGKISPLERQNYLRILTHIRDILIKEKGP